MPAASERVALLHTGSGLVSVFQGTSRSMALALELTHLVDELLLNDAIAHGSLSLAGHRRLLAHLVAADEAGHDAVLVTCSSIGPAVEAVRDLVAIPVVRVDDRLAATAVRMGPRVGVVATLRTTLEPTSNLIQKYASELGSETTVDARLCSGAFEILTAGDRERHDEMVRGEIASIQGEVDVVVLAQASMARVLEAQHEGAEPPAGAPILSSPEFALRHLCEILDGRHVEEPA
jgi:Asp/Glu/hydantoin racemase